MPIALPDHLYGSGLGVSVISQVVQVGVDRQMRQLYQYAAVLWYSPGGRPVHAVCHIRPTLRDVTAKFLRVVFTVRLHAPIPVTRKRQVSTTC